MSLRILPTNTLLLCAMLAANTAAGETSPKNPPNRPVASTAESRTTPEVKGVGRPTELITAGADFPVQLQSVFGTGSDTLAGLRLVATGKAEWVAPGKKFGDYTLESADSAKGVAIISRQGARYRLRLPLASNEPTGAAGDSKEPAAKVDPAQNTRHEKTLVNDARQLVSALAQYCAENNVSEAPLGKLRPYFTNKTLSAGTRIAVGNESTFVDFSDRTLDSKVISQNDTFRLSVEGYDKSLSQNRSILKEGSDAKDSAGGTNAIRFTATNADVSP